MTRKRTLLVLLAVAALGVGGFFVLEHVTSREPAVTLDNYDRLRAGMTLEQCEDLLGAHHGDGQDDPPGRLLFWTDRDRRVNVCLYLGTKGAEDGSAVVDNNHVRQGLNCGSVLGIIRAVLHL
jgi:hypothetical protein